MIKPEWGIKRTCKKCSVNFYDMNREPITCPKCLSSFDSNEFASKYNKSDSKRESKKNSSLNNTIALVNDNTEEAIEEKDDFDSDIVEIDDKL